VMSALYVPLFLAGVGIILRGSAYALRGHAVTLGEARVLGATFGLSSVLTPFFLGTTIGAVASGRVSVGGGSGAPLAAWMHPMPLIAGVLAVVLAAHLCAPPSPSPRSRSGGASRSARSTRWS